jgi:pterin-4a-carbinolamine dehydratase
VIHLTLGLESNSWEIVKSMIEETFAAKDLDEACSFIESIAAVNN